MQIYEWHRLLYNVLVRRLLFRLEFGMPIQQATNAAIAHVCIMYRCQHLDVNFSCNRTPFVYFCLKSMYKSTHTMQKSNLEPN